MPQVEQQIIDQLENLLLLDETPKCRRKRNYSRIPIQDSQTAGKTAATPPGLERVHQSEYKERLGVANYPAIGVLVLGSLTLVLLGAALGRIEPTQTSNEFQPSPVINNNSALITPSLPSSSFAKIPGLFAEKSTITGVIDTKTMTAVYYWGFVLKNNGSGMQQGHMTINLPDGAVVSRVTDWINGTPQEAAFNAKATVQRAYDWVVAGRHEPVLINHVSDSKIDVKAYPITPGGPDMKFCIGITVPLHLNAEGKITLTPPSVAETNFDIGKQDLHLESVSPLKASEELARVDKTAGLSILRMNSGIDKLPTTVVEAEVAARPSKFAVVATHANPTAYIVATPEEAESGFGTNYKLEKVSSKPNCPILNSRHASHRISSLWAHQEVNRLLAAGKSNDAQVLGMAYRIVSPVTSAVVLEQQGDYDRWGLHRDMYRSLGPSKASPGSSAQPSPPNADAPAMRANAITGSQTETIDRSQAPTLQGATNGTMGPQMGDATVIQGVNTSGTVRVMNMANIDPIFHNAEHLAGPVASAPTNWLLTSSRDANLFDGGWEMALVAAMLFFAPFIIFNFAGGTLLLLRGITRGITKKHGAVQLSLMGVGWLGLAYCMPLVSQLLAVLVILLLMRRRAKLRSAEA